MEDDLFRDFFGKVDDDRMGSLDMIEKIDDESLQITAQIGVNDIQNVEESEENKLRMGQRL